MKKLLTLEKCLPYFDTVTITEIRDEGKLFVRLEGDWTMNAFLPIDLLDDIVCIVEGLYYYSSRDSFDYDDEDRTVNVFLSKLGKK